MEWIGFDRRGKETREEEERNEGTGKSKGVSFRDRMLNGLNSGMPPSPAARAPLAGAGAGGAVEESQWELELEPGLAVVDGTGEGARGIGAASSSR